MASVSLLVSFQTNLKKGTLKTQDTHMEPPQLNMGLGGLTKDLWGFGGGGGGGWVALWFSL